MLRSFPIPLAFLLLLLLTASFPGSAHSQTSVLAKIMDAQASVVNVQAQNTNLYQAKPAVAGIDKNSGRVLVARRMEQSSFQRNGAGAIIHGSGILVTNAHIINKANSVRVILADHSAVPAQVVLVIPPLDLAFLEITVPNLPQPLLLADSDAASLGDEVLVIGNSPLLDHTVLSGKIIGLGNRLSQPGLQKTNELIQTSITLYPGDSGGPLFDRQGRLLGLMTAKETHSDRSSFAIPANKIAQHLFDYLDKKSKIQNHDSFNP